MKLGDYLDSELVLPDLKATTKSDVLAELTEPIGRKVPGFDTQKAHKVLLDREYLGTTGIGDGVAIPHGKLESLDEILLVVGRSNQGVDFESLDFKPCHIFFLVLAPEQVAGIHLRILAHISRLLKDDHYRESFLAVEDKDALWSLLAQT